MTEPRDAVALARERQPGDRYVKIWPSDNLVNIDAEARAMAASAAEAFRAALPPSKERG